MERETGIEPAPTAWKAEVLPLNYSRPATLAAKPGSFKLDDPYTQGVALVEEAGFEPA
jgi:hypothetical protein